MDGDARQHEQHIYAATIVMRIGPVGLSELYQVPGAACFSPVVGCQRLLTIICQSARRWEDTAVAKKHRGGVGRAAT